jgi:hypothetical protein
MKSVRKIGQVPHYDFEHQHDFEPQCTDIRRDDFPGTTLWVFNGYLYAVPNIYTKEEAKLLVFEKYEKENRRFEKLKLKLAKANTFEPTPIDSTYDRPRIPENIRVEVWRRDQGKCARCGSREKLEYDHIVPISKGGSNTTRNIELLCESCNRSKSNNVV